MSKAPLFFHMTKVDEAQRLVFGLATAEVADKSREICDYASTVPYFKAWSAEMEKASGGKSLGNVREMHDNKAVGKLTAITFNDDEKSIEVCAKIIDDSAWEKVKEGVLTGFSQGGDYAKRWKDPDDSTLTRYTAIPSEISIVDNPCLGIATFEYIKADGEHEMRKFNAPDPKTVAKALAQVWETTDGETFEKRADAITHQAQIDAAALAKGATDAVDKINKALDGDGGDPGDETETVPVKSGEADKEPVKEQVADDKASQKSTGAKFTKGLYDVSRAADMLSSIQYLHANVAFEAEAEGDDSPQPAKLKAIMNDFASFLTALCQEEVSELMNKRADETLEEAEELAPRDAETLAKFLTLPAIDEALTKAWGGKPEVKAEEMPVLQLLKALEKAGARHSKADASKLAEMGDHMDDMSGHLAKLHKLHKSMGASADAMGDATHSEHVGKIKGHLASMDKCMSKADDTHAAMEKCMGGLTPVASKSVDAGALEKMEKLEADNAARGDTINSLTSTIEGLAKRLETVEKQPMGGKRPAVHAVEKGNELRDPGSEAVDAPEADPIPNGLSPEQARARMNISR